MCLLIQHVSNLCVTENARTPDTQPYTENALYDGHSLHDSTLRNSHNHGKNAACSKSVLWTFLPREWYFHSR